MIYLHGADNTVLHIITLGRLYITMKPFIVYSSGRLTALYEGVFHVCVCLMKNEKAKVSVAHGSGNENLFISSLAWVLVAQRVVCKVPVRFIS